MVLKLPLVGNAGRKKANGGTGSLSWVKSILSDLSSGAGVAVNHIVMEGWAA